MKRIALHGVPRSGTTWLGALFDSSPVLKYVKQPLFSFAFKGALHRNSSLSEIEFFFRAIGDSTDDFINQTVQKENGSIPIFAKRKIEFIAYKEARYHHLIPHLLETDKELTMFLIIRNPLSVLASWVKAPKEFDPLTMELENEWRHAELKNGGRVEEFYGFDKWKEFALMALDMEAKYPERCRIIRYSELLVNTVHEVRECFDFAGIPFDHQTMEFIRQSKSNDLSTDAYSVYRVNQNDNKWKGQMPIEVVNIIEKDLKGTELEVFIT